MCVRSTHMPPVPSETCFMGGWVSLGYSCVPFCSLGIDLGRSTPTGQILSLTGCSHTGGAASGPSRLWHREAGSLQCSSRGW